MSDNGVKIDRDALLAVARDLNAIVVSLDRIGSTNADSDRSELAGVLLTFVDDWSVFQKLARARELLDAALLAHVESQAERDKVEQQLDRGPYWRSDDARTDP